MAAGDAGEADGEWVTARVGARGYRSEIAAREHTFVTDEPAAAGGSDAGPTPNEYLLAALGGCMVMTLRMYADRKGWPLEGAVVHLRILRREATDPSATDAVRAGATRIERRVELSGALTVEQRERLLQIGDRCPMKRMLEHGMQVVGIV